MRIAICHPQTPFARGGGEMHTERLSTTLRQGGHEVDILAIPFKWYPPSELVHQMALWRSLDVSEANGQPIDMVIALKFPAYLVRHERKVVWLIHQHRAAYELWDHPVYGDLAMHDDGQAVRDMIWNADRVALKESKRIFTNSANVGHRLRRFLGIPSDPLYHRSPICEALLNLPPGSPGDELIFPSRLEPLKRQSLAIEAMRHVNSDVRLVLVGAGPGGAAIRRLIEQHGLGDRVRLETGISDERLVELYRSSLAAYYGPYDEDYGYVTLEAMAARRPVITTTDSGGPLELVRDGETGVVVEPKPRRIAAAIDRLARDRGAAEAMGAAGERTLRRRVPEWPQVVDQLLS